MGARDPETGELWRKDLDSERTYSKGGEQKQVKANRAYDLCFSAPKSVSIAWATETEERREAIEEAVHRSVDTALQKLEAENAFVRVAGERHKADISYAKFQHSDTREQDMDLHVHALIFNLGRTSDGQIKTLDSKEIFAHIHEYGRIFRQQLQYELEILGYKTYEKKLEKGSSFELSGVSEELIDHFSKRTAQINEEVEKHPEKSRQQANLDTRKTKDKRIDRTASFERWSKECRDLGFEVEKIRDQKKFERKGEVDREQIARKALVALQSREKFQAFSEADIERQVYRQSAGKLSNADTKELIEKIKVQSLQEIGSHAERFERKASPHIQAKRDKHSPIKDAKLQIPDKEVEKKEEGDRSPKKERLYTLNQTGKKLVERDSTYSILHSKLSKPLQLILPKPKQELSQQYKQKKYEKSVKKFEQRQKSFKRKMFIAYMTGKISRSQYVKLKGDTKQKTQSKLMVNIKWLFTNKMSKRQRDYLIQKIDKKREKEIKATRETEKELNISRFGRRVKIVDTQEPTKEKTPQKEPERDR